jgi:hypothetical protein
LGWRIPFQKSSGRRERPDGASVPDVVSQLSQGENPWRRRSAIISCNACTTGAYGRFTDIRETASTESWGRSAAPPRKHGSPFTGIGYSEPKILPREDDLRRAADVLNAGKRVAILVGPGALKAGEEVMGVADKLGAGVAKALLGKRSSPTM